MKLTPRAASIILGSCLGVLLSGCLFSDDSCPDSCPEPSLFLPRTSPENLLQNLRTAYREQAWAEFESLLAGAFTFYFSEEDTLRPEIPGEWGSSEQFEHCSRLFDALCVTGLSLEFVHTPPRFDAEYFDGIDSLWVTEVSDITLEFWERPECDPEAEPVLCRTEGGAAEFHFCKNAWCHENGQPIWAIVAIMATAPGTLLCDCPLPDR